MDKKVTKKLTNAQLEKCYQDLVNDPDSKHSLSMATLHELREYIEGKKIAFLPPLVIGPTLTIKMPQRVGEQFKIINNLDDLQLSVESLMQDRYDLNEKTSNSTIHEANTIGTTSKSAMRQKTLFDIWIGSKREYDEVINFLKIPYNEKESAFIKESDNKLQWLKIPQKGFAKFLAAFIFVCIKRNWIDDNYSAPQLTTILKNTFNIEFDHKPFKTLSTSEIDNYYLKPFKHFLPK